MKRKKLLKNYNQLIIQKRKYLLLIIFNGQLAPHELNLWSKTIQLKNNNCFNKIKKFNLLNNLILSLNLKR